jgi:hypothetical protein
VLGDDGEALAAHVRDQLRRADAVAAALGHAVELPPARVRRHLDHEHAPARLERRPQAPPHGDRIREVVVDHAEQDRVAAAVGQPGAGLVAQDGPHVREAVVLRALLDLLELVRLDLRRVDTAARAHLARERRREAPVAGAHVRDGHAGAQVQRADDLVGLARGGAEGREERAGQQGQSGVSGDQGRHVRLRRGNGSRARPPAP